MIWDWRRPVPKDEDSANKRVSLGEKAMRWLSRGVLLPGTRQQRTTTLGTRHGIMQDQGYLLYKRTVSKP